jgi:hypothetical protein
MATEFDNYHGAGGAFEAIKAGDFGAGDTVTIQGEQRVVGKYGELIPADSPKAQTLVQTKNEAVAQATKTNPVTKQEVKTIVQGTAGQAVGTDSAAATAAVQPGNTANVFTQESINVIPDDTAYLNRDISQDFTEAGTLAVGAEVKVEEKNGKFYLKDAQDRYLSNATVLGSTGKKNSRNYVFNDLDSANYYLNFRGYKTPEEKRLELQTTIDIETPVEEPPVEELPQEEIPLEETPVDDITQTFVEDTVDGGTVETTGISAEEAKGDFPTSGGDFVSVIPSTEVVDLPAGETPVVDPNVPRTVVQQVTPPTYQTPTPVATPTTPTTGTYTQPLQTAGLSAVPQQVTYKTHYAGTAGAVPQSLITTAPGTGEQYTTGYQTVYYYNRFFPQQRIPVTEFNGKPTTYVPPNFVREGSQVVAQQPTADQGGLGAGVDQNQVGSEMMNQPVEAARGAYINGYAEGGMTDVELEGKYRIYTKQFGYTGPKTREAIEQFENARPEVKRKGMAIGGYVRKFNTGGYVQGYQEGSYVTDGSGYTTISKEDAGFTEVDGPFAQDMGEKYYYNPQTQQRVKVYGSGYNVPEGFVLGDTQGVFSTPEQQAAQQQNAMQMAQQNAMQMPTYNSFTDPMTGYPLMPSAGPPPSLTKEQLAAMQASAVSQTMQPMQATTAMIQPTTGEFIPVDAGQATPISPFAEVATVGTVAQADMPTTMAPGVADVTTVTPDVQAETEALTAATGAITPGAQITAAQGEGTSVSNLEAAQGTATMMDNPVQRNIQEGELISGVANAETAAQYTEQIEAATATPTKQATVQGQLEGLMAQFEGGETPAWAAGSMRTAMQTLAARGLGASSLAGQAVIQAAMEAALPIAQMDAQTQAQFESQNLSNRQQRAMLAAQQRASFLGQEFDQAFQARVQNSVRIGDIANMNFTAEQQVALENSRAANTMNLNNLSNRQALVLAEASALSNMDMANLSNRQQAAVQNAQNFLQMDMANLSNEQQTAIFKAQQNIQALFTDQAANNAASQFNASSENQTSQFFASLANQTSQFNASQQNAMDQFNVNSTNALREFNSELQQQRDLFNASNGLVIAQANAQWRQNIATINTAVQNQSNMDFAKTINALTASNMDQIWQRERDIMSFAFAAAESAADRAANIALAKLTADEQASLQDSIGQGKLAAIALEAVLGKWL